MNQQSNCACGPEGHTCMTPTSSNDSGKAIQLANQIAGFVLEPQTPTKTASPPKTYRQSSLLREPETFHKKLQALQRLPGTSSSEYLFPGFHNGSDLSSSSDSESRRLFHLLEGEGNDQRKTPSPVPPPDPMRPSSHFASKPIIKAEELERMDELGQQDGGWATVQDDIDYNKKISFSDDEGQAGHNGQGGGDKENRSYRREEARAHGHGENETNSPRDFRDEEVSGRRDERGGGRPMKILERPLQMDSRGAGDGGSSDSGRLNQLPQDERAEDIKNKLDEDSMDRSYDSLRGGKPHAEIGVKPTNLTRLADEVDDDQDNNSSDMDQSGSSRKSSLIRDLGKRGGDQYQVYPQEDRRPTPREMSGSAITQQTKVDNMKSELPPERKQQQQQEPLKEKEEVQAPSKSVEVKAKKVKKDKKRPCIIS